MEKSRLIDRTFVNTFIKERHKDLHKGDCGKVLIIAGSKGMAGAAILSARGAVRSGAGLVRVSVPDELFPIIQVGLPEATCVSRALSPDKLEEHQAVVIGPGLGDDSSNGSLIKKVLESKSKTVVIDADGLNLIARNQRLKDLARNFKGGLIITPHPGEASRLLRCTADQVNSNRLESALCLAEQLNAVTVLKGPGTVVATPEFITYINTTGNPGMATGGSGDVLSGIIGALAGQGLSCSEAAAAGVYIHGLAGDLAAESIGQYGMIASDIAAMTALAIHRILKDEI